MKGAWRMNVISALLLMAAGAMIGFPVALAGIKRVWPDLYDEMIRRSEDDDA